MSTKAMIIAAAIAALFAVTMAAQAGTCPFTGATTDSPSKCEGGKKGDCGDKEASKGKDAAKGSTASQDKESKGQK